MNRGLYARRKFWNRAFLSLSLAAAAFGLAWLTLILGALLADGVAGLSPKLFTEMTPAPGATGGLANAIAGSLIMNTLAVAVGTPIGIMAGTYLAEYGRHTRVGFVVRFVNDILLSAPSILIGLFIYEVIVLRMGHFSGFAGAAALTVIVIPVVCARPRTCCCWCRTACARPLRRSARHAASSIRSVTWRAARAGIITGVLLAVARISGETAPLLFTAFGNQFWSTNLNAPMASLPAMIFNFANSPYDDWHSLAWAGALLITFTVLALSVIARVLESRRSSP